MSRCPLSMPKLNRHLTNSCAKFCPIPQKVGLNSELLMVMYTNFIIPKIFIDGNPHLIVIFANIDKNN